MSLQIDMGWLMAVLLVSVRIAAATAVAPIFGPAQIPGAVKVFLALALSGCMVTIAGNSLEIRSLSELATATLHEALIGFALGFGFLAAYAATQVAGRVLDVQIGFGAASILNPTTQTLAPLIGTVFGMAMVMVFLALDGHHQLIRALSASLLGMPPGSLRIGNIGATIAQSSIMFTFGLALAAPVMFALWLSDVAMSVFARSMPQLNVFVLSFAVKILLGITGLAVSLGLMRTFFDGLIESVFRYWSDFQAAS
jgi:flagellar biosynthetic protein FliR